MKLNTATPAVHTNEGAPARRISPVDELRRSVLSCLLWEDQFYENGQDIASRIASLTHELPVNIVGALAREARDQMRLRHVPLLLVREMARHPNRAREPQTVAETLAHVIQRPDELTEFLAIYWKDGKQPLSKQVKKGLASAFGKFSEYQLAKYDRDAAVKLRDVLFLCHAKPSDSNGAKKNARARKLGAKAETPGEKLFERIVNRTLQTPDTWEVALSGGEDKASAFRRLMAEGKLGDLAFLRNLRNMVEAGVSLDEIRAYGDTRRFAKVLPFRFIAAAQVLPRVEDMIEPWMLKACEELDTLPGRTIILVDVSGSMGAPLSQRSDLNRRDAACGLAMLAREVCENCEVITFSNNVVQVPARRGFALRDAILNSQSHGGTDLGGAAKAVNDQRSCDRLIVITDEQSHTRVPNPKARGYVINVASYQRGVGYGPWVHIDGFSESVIRYVSALEREFQ